MIAIHCKVVYNFWKVDGQWLNISNFSLHLQIPIFLSPHKTQTDVKPFDMNSSIHRPSGFHSTSYFRVFGFY